MIMVALRMNNVVSALILSRFHIGLLLRSETERRCDILYLKGGALWLLV